MRLAIISDIHGNLPALHAVLAHARRAGFDALVNLGDIASGPLWPRETVDLLMAQRWLTLAGNHERQVLTLPPERMGPSDAFAAAELGPAQRAWLQGLPATAWLADDVFICHGTPGSDLVYWLETVTPDFGRHRSRGRRAATVEEVRERMGPAPGGRDAQRLSLALCGHSHVPRTVQVDDGPLIVNPGSVGLPAYDDTHPHWHFVENGSPHARYALVERAAQGWQVALHAVAYDWDEAARRAQHNGRPDWADALRSGRVGRTERPLPQALAAALTAP
jgi:predicted phosphodiesterase